jgi:hypothetical protein
MKSGIKSGLLSVAALGFSLCLVFNSLSGIYFDSRQGVACEHLKKQFDRAPSPETRSLLNICANRNAAANLAFVFDFVAAVTLLVFAVRRSR